MGEIAIDNQKYFSGGSINTTLSGGSTNTIFRVVLALKVLKAYRVSYEMCY